MPDTRIPIPDEVVEAAAMALRAEVINQLRIAEGGFVADYQPFMEMSEGLKQKYRAQARAAIAAALAAWQTPNHRAVVGVGMDEVGLQYPALILPLPTEASDEVTVEYLAMPLAHWSETR